MTIEQIKEQCREAINHSVVATPAPWTYRGARTVKKSNGYRIRLEGPKVAAPEVWNTIDDGLSRDSHFIAHARTFSPAAAKALLATIEWLELMSEHSIVCQEMLARIANKWEGKP